jgi:hypothetical protein
MAHFESQLITGVVVDGLPEYRIDRTEGEFIYWSKGNREVQISFYPSEGESVRKLVVYSEMELSDSDENSEIVCKENYRASGTHDLPRQLTLVIQ